MNLIKQKSRSVFYVVGLSLFLLIIQVIMYGNFFKELRADSDAINDLSRIRGGIQRYTKLELSDRTAEAQALKSQIDSMLSDNLSKKQKTGLVGVSELYDLERLNKEWEELKLLVTAYQAAPSPDHLAALISKSEKCWEVADATVIRQQYILNKIAAYYRYFTLTFGLNLLAIILVLLLYKRYVHNNLAASAIHDSLTGIFNKGYFEEYLEYEIARAARKSLPFCLIMLDIDHFKLINDTYGHRRGDYALKTLAETVQNCKRNTDVLARVGGEEFLILLPDTKLPDAIQLAERIRKCVEKFPFEEIRKMTISLGVTEFKQTDHKESLLQRVDSAMYQAKENGRNRWEAIGGEEENE